MVYFREIRTSSSPYPKHHPFPPKRERKKTTNKRTTHPLPIKKKTPEIFHGIMVDIYSCSNKIAKGVRSLYAYGQIITQGAIYYHDPLPTRARNNYNGVNNTRYEKQIGKWNGTCNIF